MLTKTVFLIFLVSFSDVLASNIRIIKTKSGDFTGLAYKGVEILQNSEENPMISVGKGTFDAYDTHGNFFINDSIVEIFEFSDISVESRYFKDERKRSRSEVRKPYVK